MLEREYVVMLLIMDVLSNVYWLAKLKKLLDHGRRCDERTNMISHIDNNHYTCKATNFHDQVMKIFNLGSNLLRRLDKPTAKESLRQVELTLSKLKFRTNPDDIWKEDHSHITHSAICYYHFGYFVKQNQVDARRLFYEIPPRMWFG